MTALPAWPTPRDSEHYQLNVPPPPIPHNTRRQKGGQFPFFEVSSPASGTRANTATGTKTEVFSSPRKEKAAPKTPPPETTEEKARRRRMIVGSIITLFGVLSAIAIVVGLVVGLRAAPEQKSQTPQPSTTIIPTGTTTPNPTATATGDGGGLTSPTTVDRPQSLSTTGQSGQPWLFWQNAQGFLSRVVLNPSSTSWTGVSNFVQAKQNTPIASTFFESRWYAGQEVCFPCCSFISFHC